MQAYGLRHQIARILFWIAVLAGIATLVLTFSGIGVLPPAALIGMTLAAFGLSALLGGEFIAGPQPKLYTVRGQVSRGQLEVRAGFSDARVESGSVDRIASIRHGPLGKPRFVVEDGVATLRMANPLLPNIAAWEAKLATNVLWDVDAHSTLGEMSLDLSHLRVERVIADTGMGRIEVKLPTRGYTQMFLSTGAGEIVVNIPADVGARLVIACGRLATVKIESERIEALDAKRYSTPDYESASTQVEIKIEVASGDVIVR